MIEGCEKSGTIVQCLLKYWIKTLNECDSDEACLKLKSVLAEGDGAIDVHDEAFGHSIIAASFAEYDEGWRAATYDIERLTFKLVGEPSVKVDRDRALIKFELTAEGERTDGSRIDPPPYWRGEHEWRQFDGEWRIVRERLISA